MKEFFKSLVTVFGAAFGVLLICAPLVIAQSTLATLRRDVDSLQGQSLDKRVAVIENTLSLQTNWLKADTVGTGVGLVLAALGVGKRRRQIES